MHEIFRPLKQALDAHDEWPTTTTRVAVIDAARHLIQGQEAQDQYVAYLAKLTLDPVQVARLIDTACTCPGPTMTDTSCPVHGDDRD